MIPGEPITFFKTPKALTIYGSSVITGAANLINLSERLRLLA